MKNAALTFSTVGIAILILVTVGVVVGILTNQLGLWNIDFLDVKDRFTSNQYCDDFWIPVGDEISTHIDGIITQPVACASLTPRRSRVGDDFPDVKKEQIRLSDPSLICCILA